MSMTRASILYGCIGDLIDEKARLSDEDLGKFYEMLGDLFDIAEGDSSNEIE